MKIGITDGKFSIDTAFCSHEGGYAFYCVGFLRHNSASFGAAYGRPVKNTGKVGVYLDAVKGELSFCIDGEDQGVAYSEPALAKRTFYAAVCMLKKGGCTINYHVDLPACYRK
jgi:hypothetical protein